MTLSPEGAVTAEQGLRYAMSLPIATTISGIDGMQVLDQNLPVAFNFQPVDASEMQSLRDQCRLAAAPRLARCRYKSAPMRHMTANQRPSGSSQQRS